MKTHLEGRILSLVICALLASCLAVLAQISPPGAGTNGGGGVLLCSNPQAYSVPGLKIYQPVFVGTNLSFDVLEAEVGAAYDLYYSTNLTAAAVWSRLAQGTNGQTTFLVPDPYTSVAWFLLGTRLDSDGDGLPDAYELLVTKTDPYLITLIDTDGDGMPDGWEVLHGLNPNVADGNSDPDGDTTSNLLEYLDGTDPNTADALTIFVGSPRGTSNLP